MLHTFATRILVSLHVNSPKLIRLDSTGIPVEGRDEAIVQRKAAGALVWLHRVGVVTGDLRVVDNRNVVVSDALLSRRALALLLRPTADEEGGERAIGDQLAGLDPQTPRFDELSARLFDAILQEPTFAI